MSFDGRPAYKLVRTSTTKSRYGGPYGSEVPSYYFPAKPAFRVPNNGKQRLKSITVFALIKQSSRRDGPIVEWSGKPGKLGTHFWIWQRNLFVNLIHDGGKQAGVFFHLKGNVPANRWNFVGFSYDRRTGILLMWVNGNTLKKHVGGLNLDTYGDVCVGVRPKGKNYHKNFHGYMSGVTLLPYPISITQYVPFRNKVFQHILSKFG
jgi:hypothetical protein